MFLLLSALGSLIAEELPPLQVVPDLDLNRYQGKWYEIARLPNRFERKSAQNVTATYTLRPDGSVEVLNACMGADGKIKSTRGTAKPMDSSGPNSKLKVTFGGIFSGDYWVLDLEPEYRWALVGSPNRKYLWVLSRTPQIERTVYNKLLNLAESMDFDASKVQPTKQQSHA